MTAAVGLLAVPAFGQISSQSGGVSNSGGAGAGTGGNSAVGNQSDNTAAASSTGSVTGLVGELLGVNISLGAPQNTSNGTAAVATGPATAAGNNSSGAISQANGGGGRGFQGGSVTNSGTAEANTGGNTAVGNQSTNVASTTQNVTGGLLGVGVVVGGPSNVSNGTATINTGEAAATGNVAEGSVTQVGGGGPVPFGLGIGLGTGFCSRVSQQVADVSNQGSAVADTGNNQAVGNASTNTATSELNGALSGDILGLDLSLGGPTNTSDGTAQITTGGANAVGNESTGAVVQENCVAAAHFGAPDRAPHFVKIAGTRNRTTPLARTGNAALRLLPYAGLLLALGVLALRVGPVPARRRNRS